MAERSKHYVGVEVVGQMNDAPEMRHVGANSIALATARIGVKCSSKVKGERKTTWMNFNLKAWHEMAPVLAEIPGGSLVKVVGDMKAEEWVGRGGEIRTSFVVNVGSVERVGDSAPPKSAQPTSKPADTGDDTGSAFEDGVDFGQAADLPF